MRSIVIGAHLLRDDIEPLAEPIAAGALFLSSLPISDDQPLGDRELLLRVAGVRAQLLEVATFIAIRYGFAVRGAAEAEAKCAPHLARWLRLLETNRDNVEVTMKIAAAAGRERPSRDQFDSGADYLRALHEATQAAAPDPAFRDEVSRLMLPLALKHRWIHRDEKSVELVALVPRDRMTAVQAAGEELRRSYPAVPFLLSGPWPLEVFADDDHE
jgi:hypothetical protein